MRLLLDSHIFVWSLNGDKRLTSEVRQLLTDPESTVHVSSASIWELSIKFALGRLNVQVDDLAAEIGATGFNELPVTSVHAWRAGRLPLHHKDPFDRMLVAQAQLEQLTLVTQDPKLAAYGVPIFPG